MDAVELGPRFRFVMLSVLIPVPGAAAAKISELLSLTVRLADVLWGSAVNWKAPALMLIVFWTPAPRPPAKNVVAPLLGSGVLMFRMLTAVPPLMVVVTVAAGAEEAMVKVLTDPRPLMVRKPMVA